MKSITQAKFDSIIKESFHATLKPLGFKKKGNNFYSQKDGLGHIINLQKSSYYSKDHIHFTINTPVFLPEYWAIYYSASHKPLPDYPTEPECILRTRIGKLRNEKDKWYDITPDTPEVNMVDEMKRELNDYILPHFERLSSKDMLIVHLDSEANHAAPLEKLIVFGELGQKEKAQKEFGRLLSESTRNPGFQDTLKEYAKKYGLVI